MNLVPSEDQDKGPSWQVGVNLGLEDTGRAQHGWVWSQQRHKVRQEHQVTDLSKWKTLPWRCPGMGVYYAPSTRAWGLFVGLSQPPSLRECTLPM